MQHWKRDIKDDDSDDEFAKDPSSVHYVNWDSFLKRFYLKSKGSESLNISKFVSAPILLSSGIESTEQKRTCTISSSLKMVRSFTSK